MNSPHDAADVPQSRGLFGLRINAFAVLVMLLIEYSLGMWVNLGITLPASDRGANVATAIGRAIVNGPIGLTLHALLGLFLVAGAVAALVRAVRIGWALWTVMTGIGLAAVVLAAVSGARFVGSSDNGASVSMALFAAVAMFSYALILFRALPAGDDS